MYAYTFSGRIRGDKKLVDFGYSNFLFIDFLNVKENCEK